MQSVLGIDADADPSFETVGDITDWLNATVETIFTTPTCGDSRAGLGDEAEAPPLSLPPRCGDFICSSPEEYPSYDPGGDARQDFQPCESDCGYLGGVNISMRVTFSDIVKLRAAYSDFDVLSEQGYAGHTVEEWGVSDNSPIGGWNICSRDKTQYGYLEHVCLFDASTTGASDGFIDGLPYRTEELDRDNAQYGGTSPTVALFEGNWELRIAFKGFTLTSNFDVAYPAVGGYAKERGRGRPPGFRARVLGISRRSLLARARSYFQFEVEDCGDDDGSACSWNTGEEYFSPCPNAGECASQFVRGEYFSDCEAGGVGASSTPCVDDIAVAAGDSDYCVELLSWYLEDYSYWDSLVSGYDDDTVQTTIDYSVLTSLPDSALSDEYKTFLESYCEKTLSLCTATDDDDDASATGDAVTWHKAEQWMRCSVTRLPSPSNAAEERYGYVNPHVYPYAAYPASVFASLFASGGFNYTGSSAQTTPPKCV